MSEVSTTRKSREENTGQAPNARSEVPPTSAVATRPVWLSAYGAAPLSLGGPLSHEGIDTERDASGGSLPASTRAFFENRLNHHFGAVRVHTDAGAADSARALDARAYTLGHDIVFGAGEYRPDTISGLGLLAHELAHVAQQRGCAGAPAKGLPLGEPHGALEQQANAAGEAVMLGRRASVPTSGAEMQVQRQKAGAGRVPATTKPKINYKRARQENSRLAAPDSLGWESKLETVAGGGYASWALLWKEQHFDAFADAVAAYQSQQGGAKSSIDGILGLQTWSRIAGIGEAIAGIKKVGAEAELICTMAAEERIKRGHRLATGKSLTLPEDRTLNLFEVILQSMPNRMLDVDEQYRGAGAAGALVYGGLGTFVPEADIWAGKLQPGAAIQVWGHKEAYDLLRQGEITEKGKSRRITDADANFYGTSFVFVRYDTDTNERMLVRHYGDTEWKKKADYEVWVAANLVAAQETPK